MADVATMATGRTLATDADVVARARTFAMDDEIIAAVQLDCQERGVRFRRDLAQNVAKTYNTLRKRQASGGDGTTSTRQIARDLYPDVGDDLEAWRRKRVSIWRWLGLLERQGLIDCEELRSRRGGGKSLGLRIGLCEIPERITMIVAAGARSSAG